MYFLRVSQKGPASIFVKLSVGPRREVGDGGMGGACQSLLHHLKLYKSKENKTGILQSTEREVSKSKLNLVAQVYFQFLTYLSGTTFIVNLGGYFVFKIRVGGGWVGGCRWVIFRKNQ